MYLPSLSSECGLVWTVPVSLLQHDLPPSHKTINPVIHWIAVCITSNAVLDVNIIHFFPTNKIRMINIYY